MKIKVNVKLLSVSRNFLSLTMTLTLTLKPSPSECWEKRASPTATLPLWYLGPWLHWPLGPLCPACWGIPIFPTLWGPDNCFLVPSFLPSSEISFAPFLYLRIFSIPGPRAHRGGYFRTDASGKGSQGLLRWVQSFQVPGVPLAMEPTK